VTDAKDDSDNMDEKEGIQSIGDLLTQRQRKRFQTGDTLLGRYRILGELGQGGMGLVFRCLDEVGGIEVAVKMLPPEVSHDSGEMEDVRENFRLVSSLVHQNICAVRTLEKDPATGEYFLVMELAQGVNLRTWRKQRKAQCPKSNNQYPTSNGTAGIPLAEILPIVRQIAAALDYAHEHKVIHRDIKLSNVMVQPATSNLQPSTCTVKVLDFGLAAQIHTSFSRVSHVRYGTSGTGPYMAPEQWEGQYQDAATDQYALAVLAYELLTGHCPFESHEATVLRESVLKSVPKCPPGLLAAAWAALQRGLAKEREERFASCGEFARALGGERISPQSLPHQGRGAQRSGKGWKCAVGLVLLVGLAAVGWEGWNQFQAYHARGQMESDWTATQASGTEEAYTQYASTHPASPYFEQASQKAEQLKTERKQREAAELAQQKMEAAWREVLSRDTEEAYNQFVLSYPNTPYSSIAQTQAARLAIDRKEKERVSNRIQEASKKWEKALGTWVISENEFVRQQDGEISIFLTEQGELSASGSFSLQNYFPSHRRGESYAMQKINGRINGISSVGDEYGMSFKLRGSFSYQGYNNGDEHGAESEVDIICLKPFGGLNLTMPYYDHEGNLTDWIVEFIEK